MGEETNSHINQKIRNFLDLRYPPPEEFDDCPPLLAVLEDIKGRDAHAEGGPDGLQGALGARLLGEPLGQREEHLVILSNR